MEINQHQYGLVKAAYSVRETLDILSIGKTTLYKLIKNKDIRATKFGKKTLFYAKDIAEFLAGLQR